MTEKEQLTAMFLEAFKRAIRRYADKGAPGKSQVRRSMRQEAPGLIVEYRDPHTHPAQSPRIVIQKEGEEFAIGIVKDLRMRAASELLGPDFDTKTTDYIAKVAMDEFIAAQSAD